MKRLPLGLLGMLLLTACFPVGVRQVMVTAQVVVVTVAPQPLAATATPTVPPLTTAPPATESLPTEVAPTAEAEAPAPSNPQDYALRLVASGFDKPLYLTHSHDGTGRMFVVEQGGVIRIIHSGEVLPEPFLDLTGLAVADSSERGLLGLAFSPNYSSDGQFFVDYTDVNGDTAIARYTVLADDPNRADPASAKVILKIKQPYANHNGGQIAFGPDGYLYIGLGDGGSAGDPQNNAQNLDSLLGKLLRIDVTLDPYAIPASNPFANAAAARPQIWAYGLRNPWRFSFDRATGDLFIADVGQNEFEEVNYQAARSSGGENYGWRLMEGQHPYRGEASAGLTPPIAEYAHAEGGCVITGGYVYRGPSLLRLQGVYLFGDYCTGKTWALTAMVDATGNVVWARSPFLETGLNISSFGEDEAGEVYLIDHNGAVYQLVAAQ